MEAVAEFPLVLQPNAKRRTVQSKSRKLAVVVSLGLHALLLLLLIRSVSHQQGAPFTKKASTVISLGLRPQVAPTPSVDLPHTPPPAPPRKHRPAAVKIAKAAPTWQTPPAPTPQPPPSPAQAAPAPTPPAPPAPTPAPAAAASTETAASPAAQGSASQYAEMPIAYLTEVSRMIHVNLNPPREAYRHGLTVAIVHIRIARDGTVIGAGVTQSTGYQMLDQEALGVVLRIHKFPEPPGESFPFTIDQPIRFLGA